MKINGPHLIPPLLDANNLSQSVFEMCCVCTHVMLGSIDVLFMAKCVSMCIYECVDLLTFFFQLNISSIDSRRLSCV